MDPEVRAKILADYPDAEDQAWRRIYFPKGKRVSPFYSTKTHQPVRGFTEAQILAYLILANGIAADCGERLRLSDEEKKLWRRHFVAAITMIVSIIGLMFLTTCTFMVLRDYDRDGVPDLLEFLSRGGVR